MKMLDQVTANLKIVSNTCLRGGYYSHVTRILKGTINIAQQIEQMGR